MDDVFSNGPSGKSRGVAGLLALFLGAVGLHYFYLNKTSAGVLFLVATLLSCGILGVVTQIVSIIQGVLFFTSTQEEFERKWVYTPSNFPLF
jgi:TM2 domain-containing membrane protein YozV